MDFLKNNTEERAHFSKSRLNLTSSVLSIASFRVQTCILTLFIFYCNYLLSDALDSLWAPLVQKLRFIFFYLFTASMLHNLWQQEETECILITRPSLELFSKGTLFLTNRKS